MKMLANSKQPIKSQLKQYFKGTDYAVPFVLDANWVNALGVVRSLGRIGLRCVAINHEKNGVALYSKYALGFVGPDPWEDPKGLINLLVKMGQAFSEKSILFVTDDRYLETLSTYKEQLSPYFHFTFPDRDVLTHLMDKNNQYQAAVEAGCSHPRSMVFKVKEDVAKWPADAFPAVLKGVSGKTFFHAVGRQALEVMNQQAIMDVYTRAPQVDLLIQEKIPGGEENLITVGCYINKDGEEKAVFTGRKLRQFPRYYGTCTVGESIPDPDIIPATIEMLRALQFYGIAQVEFKKDDRDGSYKLIEINGRFWKWHGLATACGVNLAASMYCDITGSRSYSPDLQRNGLKWIVFPEDLRGVMKDIQNKEFHFFKWLKTISPPFVFGLFAWNDIHPWIRFMISKTESLFKKNT